MGDHGHAAAPLGTAQLSLSTERGLFGPRGATVDGDRVLVVDCGNGAIEVFDRQGTHLDTWCRPGNGEGELREPVGIAVDGHGSVYVVDSGNGRIQKLDRDGRFLSAWPIPTWRPDGQLREAYIACDSAGRILVAEPSSGVVLRFTENGELWDTLADHLAVPTGVAVRGDQLLVTERAGHRVRHVRLER